MDGRPLAGDVIAGKYRIESIAGEGGMGIVYEAEHVILRQRVAVKALHPGTTLSHDAIERFSLEASAIARIASDHVVRIMDAGSLPDGAPYLVMEYLQGCDLAELLDRRGPLPSPEVVDYALQALDALAHAHAAHVIHRDLKPANLFLAKLPNGRSIIKLLDFGISKTFEADPNQSKIVGSPAYMAPEQLQNKNVDARTDIWAIGVVMFELLSGTQPFDDEVFTELLEAIIQRDAPPLPASTNAPAELAQVIARCLRRDPKQRFASTAELARALVPHGSGEWSSALTRIEAALSASSPARMPRRFETLENALQALESERAKGRGLNDMPAPSDLVVKIAETSSARHTHEVYGATMPAPSGERVKDEKAKEKPGSKSPTLESAATENRLRILLVDDSSLALAVHQHVLESAGFAVRATTEVEGLEAVIEEYKPHLLLLDLQMPIVAGDEVCRRLKAKFRATLPIVLLSDQPQAVLAERATAGGADAYLSKSPEHQELVEFVKNILAMTLSPEDLP